MDNAAPRMSLIRETRIDGVFVEWKIKNLTPNLNQNYSAYSSDFLLSGVRFYLKLFLNDDSVCEETIGWASVYLKRRNKSLTKHRISYTVGIRGSLESTFKSFSAVSEFKEDESNYGRGHGEAEFLRISELRELENLSTDDSLTFFCIARDCTALPNDTVTLTETASQTVSWKSTLEQNLENLLFDERHADITVSVRGREFRAHKSILAARSPVFAAMFDHDMLENSSGAINIDDCDPEYFLEFLRFIYTGQLDVVTSANAIALYTAADKYNLEELREKCVRCVNYELSVDTFCDAVLLASTYNESILMKTAMNFFVKYWKEIVRSLKWQSFLVEHHMLANELFVKLAEYE